MRYVMARLSDDDRTTAYRIYVANSLYFQARGKAIDVKLYDILYPPTEDAEDGAKIAESVILGAGLKLKE